MAEKRTVTVKDGGEKFLSKLSINLSNSKRTYSLEKAKESGNGSFSMTQSTKENGLNSSIPRETTGNRALLLETYEKNEGLGEDIRPLSLPNTSKTSLNTSKTSPSTPRTIENPSQTSQNPSLAPKTDSNQAESNQTESSEQKTSLNPPRTSTPPPNLTKTSSNPPTTSTPSPNPAKTSPNPCKHADNSAKQCVVRVNETAAPVTRTLTPRVSVAEKGCEGLKGQVKAPSLKREYKGVTFASSGLMRKKNQVFV